MLQADSGQLLRPTDLILAGTLETRIVLGVIVLLSIASWFVIGMKWWQLRKVGDQSQRFFGELGRTTNLREAYRNAMKLPPSPFNRLFREGISFYSSLRPGAIGEEGDSTHSLTETQLEALKMVLNKEVAAERDRVAHYVAWLATIGSVSPLLGLLGTVIGVMNAFIGIAAKGSGNISAVAPGVAEALVTTVAGLAVAIPSVMAYNHFAGKVGNFEGELEGFGSALVGWMARERLL